MLYSANSSVQTIDHLILLFDSFSDFIKYAIGGVLQVFIGFLNKNIHHILLCLDPIINMEFIFLISLDTEINHFFNIVAICFFVTFNLFGNGNLSLQTFILKFFIVFLVKSGYLLIEFLYVLFIFFYTVINFGLKTLSGFFAFLIDWFEFLI